MPGRLFQTRPLSEVAVWLGVDAPDFEEPPRSNIAPGQNIAVLTPNRTLTRMRWGIIPVGRVNARGRPVLDTIVNARSETVFDKSAFKGMGRVIVPVEGWYEWTGPARRKKAWRLGPSAGGLIAFAAICDRWEAPDGRIVDQVATVTTESNSDVAPIHHRMGVLLTAENISVWLTGDIDHAKALCVPFPDGRLQIDAATDVDWLGI